MTGPVLLCHDGSDHAEGAIRCAGTLLAPRRAVVVHPRRTPLRSGAGEAARAAAVEAGFEPVAVVEAGPLHLAAAVREEARSHGASVVVVGSHGPAGALLRRADTPVLVVPAERRASALEPVLLCHDGSPQSRGAIAAAGALLVGRAALVAAFMPAVEDPVLLRNNLPWPAAAEVRDGLARLDREEAEAPAERAEDGAQAAAAAGFAARPVALPAIDATSEEEQEPWRRLLRCAAERDAACIVVGHRASAQGASSTAAQLIQHADRPVLVVPGA